MAPRTAEQTEKIREERREQILEAAMALFAEKGFHNAKVAEIAARAGVSQGTVYWYFDSKEALFEAAFTTKFEELLQPFLEIGADASRPAADRLADFAARSLDLFADQPELAFVMLQVMATQEVARIVAQDFQDYYDAFRGTLAPLFDEIGDPDPPATANLFIGMLDGLMLQCLLGPQSFERERALAQVRAKFGLNE